MLPIMSIAAALVMGQMKRAIQSGLLVIVSAACVIAVSWFMGQLYPDVVSFTANAQITARITPRLLDLVAALAAGAAGAFAMSRDDIADSLPGVAIAISLVPPLCVAGVSLAYSRWDAVLGALLLFFTNVLAILLTGGGVLALLGLSQAATIELHGNTRRNAFLAIIIGVMIITIPLTLTGRRVIRETQNQLLVRQTAEEWLVGTEFEVRSVQVVGNTASLIISGPGTPPSIDDLVADLEKAVGSPVSVELEIVSSQKQSHQAVSMAGP